MQGISWENCKILSKSPKKALNHGDIVFLEWKTTF